MLKVHTVSTEVFLHGDWIIQRTIVKVQFRTGNDLKTPSIEIYLTTNQVVQQGLLFYMMVTS